jgi:hypothetical protein
VAHVAEEVRPPRDEVLSSALLYVRVPGFTIDTLCLRVSFHFEFSFLSADLSQAGRQETDMHCEYSLAQESWISTKPMQTC